MKETKIVELVIADDSQELAIDAISLVTSPAIEQDFVYFSKEKNNLTFAKVDEEKRELISPALIPNKQIFRYDPNTDSEYYVYFSKETVKKASHLYLKHNNHHKATEQHTDRVSGVLTVESWIKEGEQDKSNLYGFNLPIGTWFVKMKIENDEVWSKIKSGELKGLSIEGYFTNKFEQMNKKEFTNEEVKTALKELLSVQKVELGLVDDIEKLIKTNRDERKKLDNSINDWYNKIYSVNQDFPKISKIYTSYDKSLKSLTSKLDALTKQAKELGVPPRDIPAYIEGSGTVKRSQDMVDEYLEAVKSAKAIKGAF